MAHVSRVSFQLYSARNFPPLDAQLATLHRLGYAEVEPFDGLYADAEGLAALLKKHHLTAPTGHFGLQFLESDFDGAVKIAKLLGIRLVVVPYLAPDERPKDTAGWKQFGTRLSAVCEKLGTQGLDFAWHNHDFEFFKLPDGSVPLEHILGADPAVKWEADIGWIVRANEDVLKWLARYTGRVAALHVKDIAPKAEPIIEDGWADVGHGTLDWAKLIPAGLKAGAKVLIMEHDNPSDFERFARRSIETAKNWAV
jgi:sugar phosphate isomerase/epimerase